MQTDARINGNAVRVRAAIGECVYRRERKAVSIQEGELRALLKPQAASIPGRTEGHPVVPNQPRTLTRSTPIVLFVIAPGDQPVALLRRFGKLKRLRDAAPERIRFGGGISGDRKSAIARRVQRRDIARAEIVKRLIE